MHCIKCGRKIPENTVFCTGCAAPPTPVAPVNLPRKAAEKPAAQKKQKSRRKRNVRRIIRVLATLVAVLSLLLIVGSLFVGWHAQRYLQKKEDLRIREAGVILREKEADNRDTRIQALESQLKKTTQELEITQQALLEEQEAVAHLQGLLGMTPAV